MYVNETKMAKLAINKSLLKEYHADGKDRVVYMNDGDEFQIQLFNPETRIIGAEIFINNEKLPGLLVLQPGERVWLERYTNKSVKLKFSTYEVENTVEVKNAISYNGDIRIKFYRVKTPQYNNIEYFSWDMNDSVKNYPTYLNDFSTFNCTNNNTTPINGNITTTLSSSANNNDAQTYCSKTAQTYCSNDVRLTASCTGSVTNNIVGALDRAKSFLSSNKVKYKKSINTNGNKTIETGRIAEGNYSNQSFKNVSYDFEYSAFAEETIKILPNSRKPYSKSDLQKVYCTQCGRKLNSKFKFCPYCGAKCVQFED